jgi:hypothetical protein
MVSTISTSNSVGVPDPNPKSDGCLRLMHHNVPAKHTLVPYLQAFEVIRCEGPPIQTCNRDALLHCCLQP